MAYLQTSRVKQAPLGAYIWLSCTILYFASPCFFCEGHRISESVASPKSEVASGDGNWLALPEFVHRGLRIRDAEERSVGNSVRYRASEHTFYAPLIQKYPIDCFFQFNTNFLSYDSCLSQTSFIPISKFPCTRTLVRRLPPFMRSAPGGVQKSANFVVKHY